MMSRTSNNSVVVEMIDADAFVEYKSKSEGCRPMEGGKKSLILPTVYEDDSDDIPLHKNDKSRSTNRKTLGKHRAIRRKTELTVVQKTPAKFSICLIIFSCMIRVCAGVKQEQG